METVGDLSVIKVELPKLGNTVEDCLITRWVKHAGDAVTAGDVIAEIETDKTTFEITAPADGVVLQTLYEEGSLVPVFETLCVIGERGETVDAGTRDAGHGTRDAGHGARGTGQGTAGREQGTDETKSKRVASPESHVPNTAISPRASRFLGTHGLSAEGVVGSGPGGRVLETDVKNVVASGLSPVPRPLSPAPVPHVPGPVPRAPSPVRSTIARRMRESLASTAQYTLHASAGAKALLAARKLATQNGKAADLNLNHLISFCTIQALVESPEVNAEFIDGRIVAHTDVHLAFACDTPRGLIAPVIRDAHRLSLSDLATRMNELTKQAIDGTLAPPDLSGGTFTISNLGSLGVEFFTPIVNQPQVAILGVGAIRDDRVGLSLTCDHQVIDGAPGARFLQRVVQKIEQCPSQSS